jgi:hypothetical protein
MLLASDAGWRHFACQRFTRLLTGVMILFPLWIYLLERLHAARWISLSLLTAGMLIHFTRFSRRQLIWALALAAGMILVVSWHNHDHLARIYPFMISMHFTLLFFKGECEGMPLLAYYASRFKHVSKKECELLVKVNRLWVCGLGGNTVVLFGLMFAYDTRIWALYAGAGSYLLIALMFILTFCYMLLNKSEK